MKKLMLLVLCFAFISCGVVEDIIPESASIDPSQVNAYFFATDYATGQLYHTTLDLSADLSNSGVTQLGSDAIIKYYDGLLYILHRGGAFVSGSSDNVRIVDPLNDFAHVNEWSTGNSTNPHDIIVTEDGLAYITLYNAEEDEDNVDEDGYPGDLIVMNLDTGEIEKRISFYNYLNDDSYKIARAGRMLRLDNQLFVCIQDLEADYSPNAQGKLAIVDMETNELSSVITLNGQNPVSVIASADETKLYVAHQAPYDYTLFDYNTSTDFGGIEIISLDDSANSTLIDDEDLGGYVERLVSYDGKIFAVVSDYDGTSFTFLSEILVADETVEDAQGFSVFVEQSQDVRDIAIDPLGQVWVSRRTMSVDEGASDPRVDVFDSETGEAIGGPFYPDIPVVSIAFGS